MRRLNWPLSVALSLILAVAGLLATTGPVAVSAQENLGLGELFDNSDEYIGQDVTVTGQVDDILTASTFTITNGDDDDVLLVAATPETIPIVLSDEGQVEVTGTLHRFDPDDPTEWDAGERGIDPTAGVFIDFEGEPLLVADTITVSGAEQMDEITRVPLQEVILEPDVVVGATVETIGEVDDWINPQAFSLTSDGVIGELLVIGANDVMPVRLTDDSLVRVTGTVRLFDPLDPFFEDEEFENEFGQDAFDFLLDPPFAPYASEPVMVADSVDIIAPALGEMVEEILDDPEDFAGDTLTIVGRVEAGTLTPQAFALSGTEGLLGISESNLLVAAKVYVIPEHELQDDSIVQITGTIQIYDPDEPFEDDAFNFLFEGDDFADFDGEPVMIAESVSVLASEPGETVEEILDEPETFAGTTITLAGHVDDVVGPWTFTLEGEEGLLGLSEENLLVATAEDSQLWKPTQESMVVVTGTVRIFDLDDPFEEDDFAFLFEDDFFADFDGEPILLAESVEMIVVD